MVLRTGVLPFGISLLSQKRDFDSQHSSKGFTPSQMGNYPRAPDQEGISPPLFHLIKRKLVAQENVLVSHNVT